MGFSIFKAVNKKVKLEKVFTCPSCGHQNKLKENICINCSYNLKKHKDIILSGYLNYNKAYELAKSEKFLEAIIEVSKFLAFYPLDEAGNKLYIYILVKLGNIDKAKKELLLFEDKFPLNPWIMEIEQEKIENLSFPNIDKVDIELNEVISPMDALTIEYLIYRINNTNELIELTLRFYDLLRLTKEKKITIKKTNLEDLIYFYEKIFLTFLSKKELRVEVFEGKNYIDLTDEENKLIDVISIFHDKSLPEGYIKTIYPAIYLRAKMVAKQKVQINEKKG